MLDDVGSIMNVVHLSDPLRKDQETVNLLTKIEEYVLDHFMSLTANQAAQIIKHNGDHIQSAELVEICEKLIAVKIEDIVQ